MNPLLKYSNGYGHLIMSIATMAAGVFLIVFGQVALGASIIGLVTSAWFIPGAAKQVATSVQEQVSEATNTPGPTGPTGATGAQGPQGPAGQAGGK